MLKDQELKEQRAQNLKEKNEEMKQMYDARMEQVRFTQTIFGVTSTIMYLFFQFMHVSLASS
jgi:hypothetical protein